MWKRILLIVLLIDTLFGLFILSGPSQISNATVSGVFFRSSVWEGTNHIAGDVLVMPWAMIVLQPGTTVLFEKGETIRINDGPFKSFEGKIAEVDAERGKVKVLVSMFGRETPVELDFLQVKKI